MFDCNKSHRERVTGAWATSSSSNYRPCKQARGRRSEEIANWTPFVCVPYYYCGLAIGNDLSAMMCGRGIWGVRGFCSLFMISGIYNDSFCGLCSPFLWVKVAVDDRSAFTVLKIIVHILVKCFQNIPNSLGHDFWNVHLRFLFLVHPEALLFWILVNNWILTLYHFLNKNWLCFDIKPLGRKNGALLSHS